MVESLYVKLRTEDNEIKRQNINEEIMALLSEVSNIGGLISKKYMGPDNSIGIMGKDIGGGGKGDSFATGRIMGPLGQQLIGGKLPVPQLQCGQRVFPHFPVGVDTLESKGFVATSFQDGLDPVGLFSHSMSSREGIIGTATSTGPIGDLNRKLLINYQNSVIAIDKTVRDSNNRVISFTFGGNDIDPTWEYQVKRPEGTVPFFVDIEEEVRIINATS